MGGALVSPGMVGPPGDQVWRLRGAAPLEYGRAPRQDYALVLRAARHEEGHADRIGGIFHIVCDRQVQRRQQRMPYEVQEGKQGGLPDHGRRGSRVPARWG